MGIHYNIMQECIDIHRYIIVLIRKTKTSGGFMGFFEINQYKNNAAHFNALITADKNKDGKINEDELVDAAKNVSAIVSEDVPKFDSESVVEADRYLRSVLIPTELIEEPAKKDSQNVNIETGYKSKFYNDQENKHGLATNIEIAGENLTLDAGAFWTLGENPQLEELNLAVRGYFRNLYLGGGDLRTPFGFLQQYSPDTLFPGAAASLSFANGIVSAGGFAYAYAPGATQSMYNLVEALVNNDVPVTVVGGNLVIDIPNTGVRVIPYGGYISGQVPGDIETPNQANMDKYNDDLVTWIADGMDPATEPEMPAGLIPMVKMGGGIYGVSAGYQQTFHPGGNPLKLDINAAIEGWTTKYQSGAREGQPYEQKLGFGISAATKYIVDQWSFSAYVGIGDSVTWMQSPSNPNDFDKTAVHAFQTNTGLEIRWDPNKKIYFLVRGNIHTETKSISEINYNMADLTQPPERVITGNRTNTRGDIFIGVGGHPDKWEWPKKLGTAIAKVFKWFGEKLGIVKSKPFRSQ
jgi:hypothetical protein